MPSQCSVAVLGSVLSSGSRDAIGSQLGSLPAQVMIAVRESIGAASVVAHGLATGAAAELSRVTNAAFMDGMSIAMVIGAVVVALAWLALFAWIPARATLSAPARAVPAPQAPAAVPSD